LYSSRETYPSFLEFTFVNVSAIQACMDDANPARLTDNFAKAFTWRPLTQ
jgi:hypothetical protein